MGRWPPSSPRTTTCATTSRRKWSISWKATGWRWCSAVPSSSPRRRSRRTSGTSRTWRGPHPVPPLHNVERGSGGEDHNVKRGSGGEDHNVRRGKGGEDHNVERGKG